ncbi:MAG: Slp family lipoprotein [Nitrospinales bacterium]
MTRHLLLIAFLGLLAGCTSVLSRSVVEQSDRSISFQNLRQDSEKFSGKTVLVGGSIIAFRNLETGSQLEIMEWPLDYRMKPKPYERTGGRFLVVSDSKLDEHDFHRGRDITLAAEVVGTKVQPLGQTEYSYPLLRLKEYHLWPEYSLAFEGDSYGLGMGFGF